jgi:lysine 2,3-aminomutase
MARSASLRTVKSLAAAGLIDPARTDALAAVAERYAVAVTPALAELIDAGDPDDPIARQFLPAEAELEVSPIERADPIGDAAHSPVEGVIHRYPDRALLMVTNACAAYCRFCFRREWVGPTGARPLTPAALTAALDYIASRPEIWEVILSGGDPLTLSPSRIARITARLEKIDHVKVVRIHTRLPVAAPERITPALVSAMRPPRLAVFVALHANHARELTPEARAACARMIDAGIPVLSQTVLLAGVNDTPEDLAALMRAFVETRIKPYYLHHADLARGTERFRTTLGAGQALMRALRGDVSGLCQPTYVLDLPSGAGKVPVGPTYAAGDLDVCARVEDPWGARRRYPPAGEAPDAGSSPLNPRAAI